MESREKKQLEREKFQNERENEQNNRERLHYEIERQSISLKKNLDIVTNSNLAQLKSKESFIDVKKNDESYNVNEIKTPQAKEGCSQNKKSWYSWW